MAHKLDFVLIAAKEIKDPNIHFLFLGSGAEKENLFNLKEKLALKNVTMLDSVPKNKVGMYISILDVGLVNLKKSTTFKSVIPSKIFELAAMHKPILLGVEGESKELIESYGIGESYEPENKEEFINKVKKLKTEKNKEYPFDTFVADFKRNNIAKQMLLFMSK